MALWSHLLISRDIWKALCHGHDSKKSTSSNSLQLRSKPTPTTSTNPAGSVLATSQSGAASSAAPSSPISSESSSSSSITSRLETNPTPSRLSRAPSSKSSSIPPASISSLVPTASSPPTSRSPGGPHNHRILISSTTPLASGNRVSQLANHITTTCHRARSQHDHLAPPLQQLLQACRTRSCSLNGPYPAIEDVKVLIRKLRRFEEWIKRHLRLEAERGGGRGLEVIAMVRDRFSPEMRDFICGMNLLAVRVQFMGLQLGRGLGISRVPGAREF